MKSFYGFVFLLFSFQFLLAQNPVAETITDEFDASGGVKIGPDGFLYVANFGAALSNANGNQVWRVNRVTGEREVFATGLQGASGNDFDSEGNLFQSNIAGGWIAKIDPDGNVTNFTNTGINAPVGIAIDGEDNLYVANCGNNTIRKVTPDGTSTPFASGGLFACPNGITLDHEGNVYVSNFNGNDNVVKITPDGTPSVLADIPGFNNGHLTFYEPDTVLFVNSHGISNIYRVTLEGEVTKIAGTSSRGNDDGDALTEATFSRPNGIAVSPDGDTLWVNSSIPTVDNPATNFFPLNPSVVRMVTGLKEMVSAAAEKGIHDLEVNVSPNPAADFLHIYMVLKTPENLRVKLLSQMGNLVLEKNIGQQPAGFFETKIKIPHLPTGTYYVVVMGEEASATRQVVKK